MKISVFRILPCVALCALAFIQSQSHADAATSLIWQTTFDCSDWNQSMGIHDAAVCGAGDGLTGWGGWTTAGHRNGDEIVAAANNPSGGGGKGFRHWRGDGTNVNGGSVRVVLPNPVTDMWIRFYMRYQAGFRFSPLIYTKDLYVNVGSVSTFAVGFHGSDRFGISTISPSRNIDGSPGWTSVNGGASADGNWHCYETHVKMNTSAANGVAEVWVDGQAGPSARDVDFGRSAGWSYFALGENQSTVTNGGDRYTDYDDVAVSTTGRIGCAAGAGGAPPPPVFGLPAAPQNVRIIR